MYFFPDIENRKAVILFCTPIDYSSIFLIFLSQATVEFEKKETTRRPLLIIRLNYEKQGM